MLLALSVPAVSLTALAAPKETKDQHAKGSKKKAGSSDSKSKDSSKKK
jgi:hypothetical protein